MKAVLLSPLLALGLLALTACGSEDVTTADVSDLLPTYTHDVRPILERSCVPCHTSDGFRAGGVELDRYETAYETAVKNACVSIDPRLIERFAASLQPAPRDPPQDRPTCADWAPMTMPPDAFDRLTPFEQLVLVRWVELGAPR